MESEALPGLIERLNARSANPNTGERPDTPTRSSHSAAPPSFNIDEGPNLANSFLVRAPDNGVNSADKPAGSGLATTGIIDFAEAPIENQENGIGSVIEDNGSLQTVGEEFDLSHFTCGNEEGNSIDTTGSRWITMTDSMGNTQRYELFK
ncbi:uncharacterized protein IL334_000540 [Kwoniella shivajii]|uniref:Uncharacterized protein n=1 Tax=Kwoniella shivajii TaxID=564305 RepID=A0ABZ1CQG2_9TREE|nr:hypothetical protein IL334_000540 [Kwoniella shivajii]